MPAIAEARAARADADREERNRLLYVAMTRAKDRLYVGGFEGARARPAGCWYDLMVNALQPMCLPVAEQDGRKILRYDVINSRDLPVVSQLTPKLSQSIPYPDWALQHAPKSLARMVPLAPSRIAPLETEEGTGHPAPADPTPGPRLLGTGNRFLRGSLTHALLQHLPTVPQRSRAAAAKRYLAVRGAELPPKVRAGIVDEVVAILEDSAFGAVFGTGSEAEVPIAAEIALASGPPLRIAGQIDRLLVTKDTVTLIDFKTNRPPPQDVAGVPEAYLLQLAAYRLALARIYPGKALKSALLWTYETRLMEIPAALLAPHENAILTGKPWS